MRLRLRLLICALIALTVVVVVPVAAAAPFTVKVLATRLTDAPSFASPALKLSRESLQNAALAHRGYRLAALVRLPRGTATPAAAAVAVLARLPKRIGFVGIAWKGKLGGASRTMAATAVAVAAQQAGARAAADPIGSLRALADSVASGHVAVSPATKKKGSGGGQPWWLWVLIALGLGLLALAAMQLRGRSHETRTRRRGGSIGTARSFHLDRLEGLARRHADLTGSLAERPDDPALADHYETAGGKLVALRRQLAQLFSPRELRTCALELDDIEWHIECCEAIAHGQAGPQRPSPEGPGLCFFTHEHGLGTVEIELLRPDGTTAAVHVCPANAVALAHGEPPAVSTVDVGTRPVPWPAAPTWYGAPGWTLDDLPGIEYQGREIWGREMPVRDVPLGATAGPEDSLPSEAADTALEPPGRSPEPGGATALAKPPTPSVEPPSPDRRDETSFEELEAAAAPNVAAAADRIDAEHREETGDATAEPVAGESTAAYDPFAGEGERAPWERDEPPPDDEPPPRRRR